MRHAVLGGGKRFRPFLVIEAAALFGVDPSAALDTAASLECLHCYSLVHDDLPAMDNDDTRRGRPTVHRAFDDWTAILAGDALLTLAFDILARPATHPDPAVRADLVLALARASGGGGMVGGQAFDLEADKRGEPASPSVDHIRRLQAMKTGALITYAVEAGAILGGATALERSALKSYGDNLGFAFQIADDLLDAEGDAATVGKAVGKDGAAGKATLVSHLGLAAARTKLTDTERAAIAALAPFGDRAAILAAAAGFVVTRKS
jgi:farnesyl diphosphate synthase